MGQGWTRSYERVAMTTFYFVQLPRLHIWRQLAYYFEHLRAVSMWLHSCEPATSDLKNEASEA